MKNHHEEIERLASAGYITTSDAYEMVRGAKSTSTTSAVEYLKRIGVPFITMPWNGDRAKVTHLWQKEFVEYVVNSMVKTSKKKPVAGELNGGKLLQKIHQLEKRVEYLEVSLVELENAQDRMLVSASTITMKASNE